MPSTVLVCEGVLEGELVKNSLGGEYYSFKGIPYAEPPVGELRFKPLQPAKPWNGVRKATEFGPKCYQFDALRNGISENSSEDCLYLNVYTPELKPTKPIPVMVWIHGGAFSVGSGNDDFFGPSYLLKHNIILTTFNYRLEVLGFLSLESEDISGNAGMKDQVAALRWVQRNIKNFGGDPNNVTLFGESAGGASVSFHLISEMSKGLFKRAIIQSGSCLSAWANQKHPRDRALVLAKKLGCDSEDDKEIYEFFRRQPIENLVNQTTPLTYSEAESLKFSLYFSIVDEKQFGNNERFFHGDVYDILRQKGIHEDVEVFTGYTEDEGVISLFGILDAEKIFNEGNQHFEFFAPLHMRLSASAEKRILAGKQVKQRYFGKQKFSRETLLDYMGSVAAEAFVVPSIQQARYFARKNKTFVYKFTCKTERNVISKMFGADKFFGDRLFVSHADDLLYLFDGSMFGQTEIKPEIYKIIENVTKLWTNFSKYGELTPDNSLEVRCSPYTLTEQEYLDIGNQLTIRHKPDDEEFQFWEDLYRQYYPNCTCD